LIILSAIALVAGGLLARRFSIYVLLPGVVIAGGTSFLIAVVRGGSVAHGLWVALSVVVALQLGFLAGVVLKRVVVQMRAWRTSQEGVASRRARQGGRFNRRSSARPQSRCATLSEGQEKGIDGRCTTDPV
jgi:hypothetical protein